MHTYPIMNNYASKENRTITGAISWGGVEVSIDGLSRRRCQAIDSAGAFLFLFCLNIQ
jgi:hypothetical protein